MDRLGAVGLAVGAVAEVDAEEVGLEREGAAGLPVDLGPVVDLGVRQPVPAPLLWWLDVTVSAFSAVAWSFTAWSKRTTMGCPTPTVVCAGGG